MTKEQIFTFNTFNIEAYKSRGTVSKSLVIHLVITDNNGHTFEHMITKDELRKSGYRQLNILHQFSHMLTDYDLAKIKDELVEFVRKDTPEEIRYEGYTTRQIRDNIINRLEPHQVLSEDENSIKVIASELRSIIEGNKYIYGNITEEVLIQLILDNYIEFEKDDKVSYYKVNKGDVQHE